MLRPHWPFSVRECLREAWLGNGETQPEAGKGLQSPKCTHINFSANGNDSKKFKGDNRSTGVPSRVIHVRKLPSDVTEGEVISLGLPFGKVTNLLMLKGKNQAFIEMNTEEAANTMVNYYTSVAPVLRGQPIYIQFSNHKELKTDSSPNQAVRLQGKWVGGLAPCLSPGSQLMMVHPQRAQAALQAVNSVQSGNLALGASAAAVDAGMAMAGQSPVLRIIVENLFYPVTLDVLHQVGGYITLDQGVGSICPQLGLTQLSCRSSLSLVQS